MNWLAALSAMRAGRHVQRASLSRRTLIGESGGVPIYDCGTEGLCLMAAWTDDDRPVMVFAGVNSRTLAVPGVDDMTADDWEIVG